MKKYDVIIIGGGAAGLMCAFTAGQRGRKVLVLERSNKFGKKILMSGGGRCNFTNLYIEPDRYVSHNPHFCKSALSRYTQWDFIALVEKHNIAYHEKTHGEVTRGQLFCDNSSKDILAMLLNECEQAKVELRSKCDVETAECDNGFRLETSIGTLHAESLVVASGGLSVPTLGGSGFGYELAKQYGMKVFELSAGLVPFTFSGQMKELFSELSGVSLPVTISYADRSFNEDILFTHRGLSGPAVLQLSSYWQPGENIEVNLLPALDVLEFLRTAKQQQPKSLLRSVLTQHLPKKLVLALESLWWPTQKETALAEVAGKVLDDLAQQLSCWQLKPSGTEGYRTAEVTLGGIDTDDISSKTMESKTRPNLYFIGEVLDVSGHLGGFNFQWAWASAVAAGEVV